MPKLVTRDPITPVWEPTAELLEALNPDNPRDHFEADIKATALSLLEAGWAEFGVCRQRGGYLIGGHGRVQAAHWLSQQSLEWFGDRWNRWVSANPERQSLAEDNRQRFTPDFWLQCPVVYVNLDEKTQKATMIRLNNPSKDGRDNPKKLAKLLAEIPDEQVEQSGWDARAAESYKAAFLEKVRTVREPDDPQTERMNPQVFSRPDATDYRPSLDDREEGSDDLGFEDDGFPDDGGEDSYLDRSNPWDESELTSQSEFRTIDLDTDNIAHTRNEKVHYDTLIAPTREVMLMVEEDKLLFKSMAFPVAQALGMETTGSVKKWRPKAVIEAMKFVLNAHGIPILDPESPGDSDDDDGEE